MNTVRTVPVSVLVIVTSTPGRTPPLESFTTPETCEPATAWAQPVPAARSHDQPSAENRAPRFHLHTSTKLFGERMTFRMSSMRDRGR